MSGFNTPGLQAAAFPLTGNEQAAFDTQLGQGLAPESEAITVSQLKGYFRPTTTLAYATTLSTNAALSEVFSVTLTGNTTLANPTNLQSGQTIKWEIVQDAAGGRTVAYGTLFKFSGSSTVSTTASAVDLLSATYDGAILLASLSTNFR